MFHYHTAWTIWCRNHFCFILILILFYFFFKCQNLLHGNIICIFNYRIVQGKKGMPNENGRKGIMISIEDSIQRRKLIPIKNMYKKEFWTNLKIVLLRMKCRWLISLGSWNSIFLSEHSFSSFVFLFSACNWGSIWRVKGYKQMTWWSNWSLDQ